MALGIAGFWAWHSQICDDKEVLQFDDGSSSSASASGLQGSTIRGAETSPAVFWLSIALATAGAALLEAVTDQLDNLVVPVYYTSHLILCTSLQTRC